MPLFFLPFFLEHFNDALTVVGSLLHLTLDTLRRSASDIGGKMLRCYQHFSAPPNVDFYLAMYLNSGKKTFRKSRWQMVSFISVFMFVSVSYNLYIILSVLLVSCRVLFLFCFLIY